MNAGSRPRPRRAARPRSVGRLLHDEAALRARRARSPRSSPVCAFISPSTSVRKSSRRSDQRMPPRATRPGAQVHAFDARRVHEDLEHRPRQRAGPGIARGIELEHDARTRRAVVVGLEPVRAQRREHEVQQRCAGCGPRRGSRRRRARSSISVDERGRRRRLARPCRPRVEAGDEQLDQPARDVGMGGERRRRCTSG